MIRSRLLRRLLALLLALCFGLGAPLASGPVAAATGAPAAHAMPADCPHHAAAKAVVDADADGACDHAAERCPCPLMAGAGWSLPAPALAGHAPAVRPGLPAQIPGHLPPGLSPALPFEPPRT